MPTKPGSRLEWTDGEPEKVEEPNSLKKALGWESAEKPPFQWFNWLFWIQDKWNDYLEAKTDETAAALATTNSTVSGLGSSLSSLSGTVSGHTTAIGTLNTDLDAAEAAAATLTTTVGGHTTTLGTHTTQISALQAADTAHDTAIAGKADASATTTALATKLTKPSSPSSGNMIEDNGSGGSNSITKAAMLKAAAGFTAIGDLLYGGTSGVPTKIAGPTVAKKQVLSITGDGTNSAAPVWGDPDGGLTPDPKNGAFTAVVGKKYLLDLASPIAIAMPPGAVGAQVGFFDSKGIATLTNKGVITPNGTDKFQGGIAGEVLELDGKFQFINAMWDATNSHWAYETGTSVLVGPASATTEGTVKGGTVPSNLGAADIAYPNIGYKQTVSGSGVAPGASGVPKTIVQLTLQPGIYRLRADGQVSVGTATGASSWYAAISTITNSLANPTRAHYVEGGVSNSTIIHIIGDYLRVAVATTYYFVLQQSYTTAGSMAINADITAELVG